MEYKLPLRHINVPDKKLLADLKRAAKKLKLNTLSSTQYNLHGKYIAGTIAARFGGWNQALRQAGLESSRSSSVSTEDLFENLKKVWDTLGKNPAMNDMRKPLSKYSPNPYVSRFGSWLGALEAFIQYMNCKTVNERKKLLGKISHTAPERPVEIAQSLRFKVLQRDNFKCRVCGSSPATDPKVQLHADHITAFSNGGATTMNNLQTLCSRCNLGKGTKKIKKIKK